ncbi:MAG: twin-arginine translocation signal domain-containing protein, partial [Pseudomonadota bacterium]|nr:twin-arginine translocation signal domain-containing protein [Pseudomonadota bacterium]
MASIERRRFLARSALISGAVATGNAWAVDDPARSLPPFEPPWSRTLGAPILASPYGVPARYEANVQRRQ